MVWYQYQVPNPQFPPPTDNGWNKEGNYPLFITTLIPLSPTFITFITYLVICGCKQNKCCSKCSWGSQQLNCSEMCPCGAHKDVCENVSHDQTLGSMMKRRKIHHSKNCEITTCLAANIVLCENSDSVKRTVAAYILLHIFVDTELNSLMWEALYK